MLKKGNDKKMCNIIVESYELGWPCIYQILEYPEWDV